MAIRSFKDKVSQEMCDGVRTKQSLKRLPSELHLKAQIKLARLAAATSLSDLSDLRGNRLERLKGDRGGQYSIQINDQYRICFRWIETDAYDVEITDYHLSYE
jgi:toxin HigB-1